MWDTYGKFIIIQLMVNEPSNEGSFTTDLPLECSKLHASVMNQRLRYKLRNAEQIWDNGIQFILSNEFLCISTLFELV